MSIAAAGRGDVGGTFHFEYCCCDAAVVVSWRKFGFLFVELERSGICDEQQLVHRFAGLICRQAVAGVIHGFVCRAVAVANLVCRAVAVAIREIGL